MDLNFSEINNSNAIELANWLSSDTWPFFNLKTISKEEVLQRIADGKYFNEDTKNFWIKKSNGEKVGLIEIFDLNDLNPWFSLRISTAYRGQGIGKDALNWMTRYIFDNYSTIERIEGRTREDNVAMRYTFNKCGYRKEGYFRRALVTESGQRLASIGYAITRYEWTNGVSLTIPWHKDQFFSED